MRKYRRPLPAKILLYAALTVVSFALQSALTLPPYVHPLTLIALTALGAFHEGGKFGASLGAVCGILADWLSSYTVSYYTAALIILGAAAGAVTRGFLRRNVFSAALVGFCMLFAAQITFFTLHMLIPGKARIGDALGVMPFEVLYGMVWLVLLHPLCRLGVKRLKTDYGK